MDNEKYYYLRNSKNVPLVSVCIIKRGDEFGKGILLCSEQDTVNKKVGRMKAKGRALQALGTQATSDPIVRKKAGMVLGSVADWYLEEFLCITENPNKSQYNPELTEFELKLFNKGRQTKEC